MLKLYDFPESVCCQKVRLALSEKGVPFKEHPVMLDQGMQYDEAFLKLNPKGVVPVAVHDGQAITESTIISLYIDEAFEGPALQPQEPYWRARARYWARQIDDGIHNPHCTTISFVVALRFAFLEQLDTPEKLAEHLANVRDPVSRERQRQGFELGYEAPSFVESVLAYEAFLGDMEAALAETPWLAGDDLTLADLDVAPYVHRLECLQLSQMWSGRPHIADWYARIKARPSWGDAIVARHIDKWLGLMEMGGKESWGHVEKILADALPAQ